MEAIRTIQTVENGQVCLQLPEQFWGQEVEIIVLSMQSRTSAWASSRKSLRGSLKRYANPELMSRESSAWLMAVSENDESR